MSLVFIGTPAFAVPCLQRLVADGHTITAVVTQPDRPAGRGRLPRPPAVKIAALKLGLPVLQPNTLRDPEVFSQLSALTPEAIVAVAYGQILRPELLAIPPRGVLNIHPSLLPRWRGASPIPAAILAGDEQTGVTIMLMDAGMDSGPILTQRPCPIDPADTTASLAEELSHVGAGLLAETLPRWLAGEIEPSPQDEARVTTCPLLRKEDGLIDWTLPATDIWRSVRAYNPWPGAHTRLDGEMIHIWRAWPIAGNSGQLPGTVLLLSSDQLSTIPEPVEDGAFGVQANESILAVLWVQRASRRALPANEFLRGAPNLIGRRLG